MNQLKPNPFAVRTVVRVAVALGLCVAGLAHATTTPLAANGQWVEFDVDDVQAQSTGVEWIDYTDGSALSFTFTVTAPVELRVVDAGFAGDTFNVSVNGVSQLTSAVAVTAYSPTRAAITNFDAAWADASFSRGSWLLTAPGNYTVTGVLAQSVTNGAAPLNATIGAVMLAAVPEPGTWALLLAGLALLGLTARRRA
jgi:PEP-CTERM motif